MSFYQLWLDDLFPKAKFLDALSMVEKAGHKNQLRLKRIQWIDEGRPKPAGFQDGDGDDDLFGDANQPEERDPAIYPARIAPIFQNSVEKRAKTPDRDDPFADVDIYDASPKRPTNATSTTASVFGNGGGVTQANDEPDEDDLDALMAEEEAQRTTSSSSIFGTGKTTRTIPTQQPEPDDDDLDALMAEAEAESSTTRPAEPANRRPAKRAIIDDDEDDLDALMAEAEAEGATAKKSPSRESGAGPTNQKVDEDEEAAMAEMEGLW